MHRLETCISGNYLHSSKVRVVRIQSRVCRSEIEIERVYCSILGCRLSSQKMQQSESKISIRKYSIQFDNNLVFEDMLDNVQFNSVTI